MKEQIISVTDSGVEIALTIPNKMVGDYLKKIPAAERERAFVHAVEVGVFCLERAGTSQDLDFVRSQIGIFLTAVETQLGMLPRLTQEAILAKIGTGSGQVLEPLKTVMEQVQTTTADRIKDVRNLLADEIDPSKQTSVLGQALASMRNLLDPNRTDSVQGRLDQAVKSMVSSDGTLAAAVKRNVEEALKPLQSELDSLGKEIRGKQSAQELANMTTLKGKPFEEEVTAICQGWGTLTGAEVYHVGSDNQPGDVVVKIAPDSLVAHPLVIVIEARAQESAKGRRAISDDLTGKMAERKANYGIYVSQRLEGLAKEIGEWQEGETQYGPWVACTVSLLPMALRFAVVKTRLQSLRASRPEVDASSIEAQVQRIRTGLGKVANITRKVTEVRGSAQGIQEDAEALRDEIKTSLQTIEEALRRVPQPGAVLAA